MARVRRELTTGEMLILRVIRQQFGSQNDANEVFFTDSDEAVIFVKASDGTIPVAANLTHLAAWHADGTIFSDEELVREWFPISN